MAAISGRFSLRHPAVLCWRRDGVIEGDIAKTMTGKGKIEGRIGGEYRER